MALIPPFIRGCCCIPVGHLWRLLLLLHAHLKRWSWHAHLLRWRNGTHPSIHQRLLLHPCRTGQGRWLLTHSGLTWLLHSLLTHTLLRLLHSLLTHTLLRLLH